jgi:hypothetical protein
MFSVKDTGRSSLANAISDILGQEAVYTGVPAFTHAAGGYIIKCAAKQKKLKGANAVNIRFNVTSAGRKALVKAISEVLSQPYVYNGAPTFAYAVGGCIVDRDSVLIMPPGTARENAEHLITAMKERGYDAEVPGTDDIVVSDETLDFNALQMTEREELGLGRELRDHPGENGPQPSDVSEPEDPKPRGCTDNWYAPGYVPTYRAILNDPEFHVREEIFMADNDVKAINQALEYCQNGVTLRELQELDYDHTFIRIVDPIAPMTGIDAPASGESDNTKLIIEIPIDGLTDNAIKNLGEIISSKNRLIMKALGTDSLSVDVTDVKLRFPWFTLTGADGEADAYSRFICALCDMAKTQTRVTAKERETGNDKFTMRLFLIRLGFIGPEYKTARKILLRNLTGNSAFRNNKPETEEATIEATPNITCLNCGHMFTGTVSSDDLGEFSSCPECKSSFDV